MSMRQMKSTKSAREIARSRRLMLLAAIVLFAGLFVQITMLSRISAENKRASRLEGELAELSARAENLELSINQYHDLSAIALQAQQMGMEVPDDTQIRVVSVARSGAQNTSTQTVEAIGGEKVSN